MSHDTAEGEALANYRAGTATKHDLLLLARSEIEGCLGSLPPGEGKTIDPMHASACALRALGFVALLLERGGSAQ